MRRTVPRRRADPHAARTRRRKAARLKSGTDGPYPKHRRKAPPRDEVPVDPAVHAAWPSTRPRSDADADRMWMAHWVRYPESLNALLRNMIPGIRQRKPRIPKGRPQDP